MIDRQKKAGSLSGEALAVRSKRDRAILPENGFDSGDEA
jgi:hypothetical protein